MANQINYAPDFGNWVSNRLIYIFSVLGVALLALAILVWYTAIPAFLFLMVALYFAYARYLFSQRRKRSKKIWETAITNLEWNSEGKAIDIGCGNGALTIKLAVKFPTANVIGIDFWGDRWEYTQNTCESNAKAAGVGDRTVFHKASASKLPFEDGNFDAAVSNLCFHEVADSKDNRELIREALRVVKKGGKFAFQDLFLLKPIYGDIDMLVATIKSWG